MQRRETLVVLCADVVTGCEPIPDASWVAFKRAVMELLSAIAVHVEKSARPREMSPSSTPSSGQFRTYQGCVCEAGGMGETVGARLVAEVAELLKPLRVRVRPDGGGFVADLVRADGSVLWPNYADGPDELLTTLAVEQRLLVEDRGRGSVAGATYVDKARERLRRASGVDT